MSDIFVIETRIIYTAWGQQGAATNASSENVVKNIIQWTEYKHELNICSN
jgi:hypothetical protein